MKFSVVIAVYNRPDEVHDLLTSLANQSFKDFEVIVVEDGSELSCKTVVETFSSQLSIVYLQKTNSGPGPTRNLGMQAAQGEYLVLFDSDCIIPPQYFTEVLTFIQSNKVDVWGGPDAGHESFSVLQRAMAFTMSSFWTTGGIRGGSNSTDNFQPRSFNMGIRKAVLEQTGGFQLDRYAEDIEWSIRLRKLNFNVALIRNAFVWHKRRTSLNQFFHQVYNFGRGRVEVSKYHPEALKITHWFPSLFVIGIGLLSILLVLNSWLFLLGLRFYLIYLFLVALSAVIKTRSILVGVLCIPSSLIQLTGYGMGFLSAWFQKIFKIRV